MRNNLNVISVQNYIFAARARNITRYTRLSFYFSSAEFDLEYNTFVQYNIIVSARNLIDLRGNNIFGKV